MDFYKHLEKYLSNDEINKLKESITKDDCHAAILNLEKMDDDTFLSLFPNVKKHPLVEHAYIFNKEEYQLGKTIYHEMGCFYIQEPSAMIVSSLIDFKDDDFVLDLCAAPGGKSIQASFKMNQKGLIISNDLSKSRSFLIANNAERLGLKNIIVTNNDFSLVFDKYLNTFDKIILDAPCSGSGMFRKDEKFIEDWSINKVLKYREIQKELINYAYKMLKPGGILSYSTCSYSYEEDEEIIEYLLNNTDAEIVDIPSSPYFYVDAKKPYGVHLLSSRFEGEGQYIAHIKKPGISSTTFFKKENKFVKELPFLKDFHIEKYGNTFFGIRNTYNLKGLSIIKTGFKIGEIDHNDIKYDYNLSHILNSFDNEKEINEEEAKLYLLGNTIDGTKNNKGYILLKYKKIPLSFGKNDGRIIKNHYPKGLRKKI